MLVGQWSSEDVPEHHQFDFVRALLLDTPVPIRIERPGVAPERAFGATAELHAFAPDVMMARNTGQAAIGLRESQEIARGAPDNLWVLRYRTTAGTMALNGRPYHVEPGDVLFGDCGVQQLGDGAEYVEFEMWMLPVSHIKPLLADPAADPVGHLKVGTPLGHLVSSFVGDLGAALATVDGQGVERLTTILMGLLALGAGASGHVTELVQLASQNARLSALLRDIADNHCDPALDPPSLARRQGISVRTLHLLFEPTGKGCARTLTEARLTTAIWLLQQPSPSTVADIVFASGFESLSTFYRVFRDRYGHGPGELRSSVVRGPVGRSSQLSFRKPPVP